MTDQEALILLAPVAVTAAFAATALLLRFHIIRRYQLRQLHSDALSNGHLASSRGEASSVSGGATSRAPTNIVVRSEEGLSVLHLKSIAASDQDKEDLTTYLRRLAKLATHAPTGKSAREISREAQIEKVVTTIANSMTGGFYVPVKILQDTKEDEALHSAATMPSSTKSR